MLELGAESSKMFMKKGHTELKPRRLSANSGINPVACNLSS
jgi:hypothetical protein